MLDDLADKPGARHHVINAIGSLFRWALDREIIQSNPATGLPRPKLGVRERALADDEVPIVWKAADAVGYPFGPFMQLLTLTACRRGEIAGLRWSEIDLDKNTITVPGERYKTGRTLVVPVRPMARQIIDRMPRFEDGDHVLSTTCGRRPISGYSKMKRRFDAALVAHCEKQGHAPFEFDLHDIRRTVRTSLSALRVQPHIAEAVLGHVITGVQKHYDTWTYLDEKREALEAWARKMQSLIEPGKNVVSIRA